MAKTAATPDPATYCRKCSYDLRGQVEHRCPECGRPYDPADAKTFRRKPKGSAGKWLKRIAAALVVLLLLAAAPYAWLYYDWRQEQPAVARMKGAGARVITKHINLPILPRLVPGRYGWMLERVDEVHDVSGRLNDDDLILLSRCRRLEVLVAPESFSVSDKGLEALAQCQELHVLIVSGRGITDASARRLAQCPRLVQLWLCRTSLTDGGLAALANLPNLGVLWVEAPSIDDDGLAILSRLSGLKHLLVSANHCTPAGEKRLRQSLPNCHIKIARARSAAPGEEP